MHMFRSCRFCRVPLFCFWFLGMFMSDRRWISRCTFNGRQKQFKGGGGGGSRESKDIARVVRVRTGGTRTERGAAGGRGRKEKQMRRKKSCN